MKVSLFSGGAADNRPIPLDIDWPGWVALLKKNGHTFIPGVEPTPSAEKAAKLQCPTFSPAEFKAGGKRRNEDVQVVHFGVMDLDHIEVSEIADLVIKLETDGIEYLIYSAWSHSDTHLSLRCMVPFSRPVPAPEWSIFWARLNQYFNGLGDTQCKEAARIYFLPATTTGRAPHAFIRHVEGRPLDVDTVSDIEVSPQILLAARTLSPVSREELNALAKKLVKSKPQEGFALVRVLAGEPWAEKGHRDKVLYALAREIATAFPTGDPASIGMLFAQSCTHFNDFKPEDVAYKIRRRQEELVKAEEAKLEGAAQARKLLIKTALGRENPYSEAEVKAFSEAVGCTEEEFRKRWILQRGGSIYVFCGGKYLGPWPIADSKLAAHTYLSPATSVGVRLEELDFQGQFIHRQIGDLALDYGTPVLNTMLDLTAKTTWFDAPSSTIIEAPCPLRDLTPEYNQHVDRWLRALGGSDYPSLQSWISWVTSLDLPCAALFIEGPPGCGKSLFAKGIARLWTTNNPTTLEQVLASFNSALADCPLVFADEKMPTDGRGRSRTAELREIIQADSRPLKRKNLPDATIRGAVRVIIAANNHHIIDGDDNLSPWDIDAIVQRIVHIRVSEQTPQNPSRLLAEFSAQGLTKGWVSEDSIAKHALWMIQHTARPSNPPRFLVQQEGGPLHRALTTSTSIGNAVAHWLVNFLLDPGRLRMKPTESAKLVTVREGRLYVNPKALIENWEDYSTNVPKEKATARTVASGVRGISDTTNEQRVSLQIEGVYGRPKFYRIRTQDLIEWAENTGICTKEDILERLAKLSPQRTPEALPPASA